MSQDVLQIRAALPATLRKAFAAQRCPSAHQHLLADFNPISLYACTTLLVPAPAAPLQAPQLLREKAEAADHHRHPHPHWEDGGFAHKAKRRSLERGREKGSAGGAEGLIGAHRSTKRDSHHARRNAGSGEGMCGIEAGFHGSDKTLKVLHIMKCLITLCAFRVEIITSGLFLACR